VLAHAKVAARWQAGANVSVRYRRAARPPHDRTLSHRIKRLRDRFAGTPSLPHTNDDCLSTPSARSPRAALSATQTRHGACHAKAVPDDAPRRL